MMSLLKRYAFTKWAHRIFLAQSLFLDMSIIFYELQDVICGWLVKLLKIDGTLFLDIGRSLFLDCQSKNRSVEYY